MSNCITPPRIKRVLVCPPAPKRSDSKNRRPSFFEPLVNTKENRTVEIQSKIDMVRNFLNYFPSGTFNHTSDVSDAVITELSCRCERISIDTCVYTKI
jgi:hypothetical protein